MKACFPFLPLLIEATEREFSSHKQGDYFASKLQLPLMLTEWAFKFLHLKNSFLFDISNKSNMQKDVTEFKVKL